MKFYVLVTVLFVSSFYTYAQNSNNQEKAKIQWMDLETAIEKQKEQPKTIMVDLYTDWCGWCKKLDKETFSNPEIAAYISQNFYPVKFDAETTDTINYYGKTYVNKGEGRRATHQLAYILSNSKKVSYPTTIFIDENGKPNPVPGFLNVKKIEPVLVFFSERIYKSCDYDFFHRAFKTLYRPEESISMDTSGSIRWLDLDDALTKQTQEGKKVLFLFYSDTYQPIASNLMLNVNIKNPHIADYINKHYHPVLFNAARTDTITMFGQTYINEQKAPGYPHQFVIAVLNNKIRFPSLLFLNKNNQLIAPIQGYYNNQLLEPYLHYIATDIYKSDKYSNFQEYYSQFNGKIKKKE